MGWSPGGVFEGVSNFFLGHLKRNFRYIIGFSAQAQLIGTLCEQIGKRGAEAL
jgi:hypothetical protein